MAQMKRYLFTMTEEQRQKLESLSNGNASKFLQTIIDKLYERSAENATYHGTLQTGTVCRRGRDCLGWENGESYMIYDKFANDPEWFDLRQQLSNPYLTYREITEIENRIIQRENIIRVKDKEDFEILCRERKLLDVIK